MRRARIKGLAAVPVRKKPVRDTEQACSISTETSGVLDAACEENLSHALGREATSVAAEQGRVNHLPDVVDTSEEARDASVPGNVRTEPKREAALTDVGIVAPATNSDSLRLGPNFHEMCVKPDFREPRVEAESSSKESRVPVNEESSRESSPRRKLDLRESCTGTKLESCDRIDDSPERLVRPAVPERVVPVGMLKGTDVVSPVKAMSNRPCFVRPVPRLDSGGRIRKNSVQGSGASASESEDEYGKRTVPPTPNRVRNDSVCSVRSNRESVDDSDRTDFPRIKTAQKRRVLFSESARKLAEARKEFLLKHENKTPDRSQLKMYDLIYYNPVTNPMKRSPETPKRIPITPLTAETPAEEEEEDDPTAMPVPRVKVGPDGQLIIDEQSLVIESSTVKRAKEILSTDVIVEDENCHGGGFYKKRKRGKDWPNWETVKFYQVLNVVGTDFVLMQTLFPNRTRQEIKQKYKKEERVNCHLIQKALKYHQKFDTEMLEQQLAMLQKLEHIPSETRDESSKRRNNERCTTKAAKKRRHRMVAKSIGECESSSVNDPEDREENLSDEIDSEASGETSDARHRRAKRGSKSRESRCLNVSDESDEDGSRATAQNGESTCKLDSDSDPEVYRVRPTRSGRLSKSKKFRSGVNVKRNGDTKDVSSVNGTTATSSPREATVVNAVPADNGNGIAIPENLTTVIPNIDKMEPGSLVILSKKSTEEPENTILQVYMVSSNTANAEDECDVMPVDLPPKFLTVTDKLNEAESINASDDCEQ